MQTIDLGSATQGPTSMRKKRAEGRRREATHRDDNENGGNASTVAKQAYLIIDCKLSQTANAGFTVTKAGEKLIAAVDQRSVNFALMRVFTNVYQLPALFFTG